MNSFYFERFGEYNATLETSTRTVEALNMIATMYGEDKLSMTTKPTLFFNQIWSFAESFKQSNQEKEVCYLLQTNTIDSTF